ncbi:MAG: MBL fold metallo-hydrolase [Candidatus Altiarchaeales archaeon]|nr:MBL fold metallo-hydrolase [Candidatus Altiarchaeales archaeon]MBD3415866.1 MBL fold metallo-hydrolase [Candidatus Altiarchaeales archaeon]
MEVVPVAFESLGVRSMATVVRSDLKVFIDPSAALGPTRYGLPPHKLELQALAEAKKRIREEARDSDILIVTHYHYDHHDPGETFYKDKVVLAKDTGRDINKSQQKRGGYFKEQLPGSCDLRYADGRSFEFKDLQIDFSPPVPHGPPGIRLGYVLMCRLQHEDDVVVYGSDVQGPVDEEATEWIIEAKPRLLIMDGPPTYFLGYKFSAANMERAKANMLRIIEETGCEVILEHHLLRDLKHRERFKEVYETGKARSAAEYRGVEENLLEMRRKELWKGEEK